MPPTVNLDNTNTFHLTVPVWNAPATSVRLDFSLQRHHYLHTDAATSEVMNSLFHADVTTNVISGEMTEIGLILQQRAQGVQQQGAGLARAAFAAATKAGGQPAAPSGPANRVAGLWQPPTALWDDYTVASGRTYRVDATNQQSRTSQVNHLYVIAGPKVWGGVSQQNWLAAQALRRVEREMGTRIQPDQILAKYNSMRADPQVNVNTNQMFRWLESARTVFRAGCDLEALKRVSGNEPLVIALARLSKV